MKLLTRLLALPIILLVLTAGFASASTIRYIDSFGAVFGYVDGNLTSLRATDGNTFNITETLGAGVPSSAMFPPISDSQWTRWGTICSHYYNCVDDGIFPDFNRTIVWTTNPSSAYLSLNLNGLAEIPPDVTIQGVQINAYARANQTPLSNSLTFKLTYWLTGADCGHFSPTMTLEFNLFQSPLYTNCGANPWNYSILNHLRLDAYTGNTNWVYTITDEFAMLHELRGTYAATVLLNSTVGNNRPVSLNWTCNRTATDTWYIYYYDFTALVWQLVSSTPCPVGALADGSFAISPTLPIVGGGGGQVQLKISGYNFLSIPGGKTWWDRFVVYVNPPTVPSGPSILNLPNTLAYLFLIAVFIIPAIWFALWARRRRQG